MPRLDKLGKKLKNQRDNNLKKPKLGKGRELFIGQELYRFTPEQWQLAENLAKSQQKSYADILKFIQKAIRDQKRNSRRQAKQKARWRNR